MLSKRSMIILVIASSILYICYLCAEYYGWIRYYKLCSDTLSSTVLTNFKTLPELSNGYSIQIVLNMCNSDISDRTTISTINSLLDQSVRPKSITVVTPDPIELPSSVDGIVRVITTKCCSKDTYDDVRYVAQTVKDANTYLVSVIPGIIYGPDYLENMIDHYSDGNVVKDGNDYGIVIHPDDVPLECDAGDDWFSDFDPILVDRCNTDIKMN